MGSAFPEPSAPLPTHPVPLDEVARVPGGEGDVTICICTFRRPYLAETLRSILDQHPVPGSRFRIVVADNDDAPSAKAMVDAVLGGGPLPFTYVHAPARNISIARNAALAVVTTRWAAFLDDDELAAPEWIARLMAARHGAHAVFGPVIAHYPASAPRWAPECDFHGSAFSTTDADTALGHTCNVLIDMAFVRTHRLAFTVALGRTGGEDTLFFSQMRQMGGALRSVPDAVVNEHVVPERITMKWVFRRKFRAGQTYALAMLTAHGASRAALIVKAGAKLIACAGAAVLSVLDPVRARRWAARGVLHAGVLAYCLGGGRIVTEY